MSQPPDTSPSPQSLGGEARAKSLSVERRKQIAVQAAKRRWTPANAAPNDHQPELTAQFGGVLPLGGAEMDVYVLNNGERVIALNKVVKAITGKEGGNLGEYIGVSALKPFLNKDLILGESREFSVPGTQFRGRGIKAERFLEICHGYVSALQGGDLTDRQKEIAITCSILLSSCAKVGLIALIDEATGYQFEREEDALQVKLRAFIAEELRAWEKTFPDELWQEFGRLTNWSGALHHRPKWWGKLVVELVYDTLDPDVADYIKKNKPQAGVRWHQQFSENHGVRKLVSRCYEVVGMAKTCTSISELRGRVAQHYGKEAVQLTFYLPVDRRRHSESIEESELAESYSDSEFPKGKPGAVAPQGTAHDGL